VLSNHQKCFIQRLAQNNWAIVLDEKFIEQLNKARWYSLKTLDLSIIPSSSGVYQIRWAVGGKPQPIPRANGNDEKGILYIGESSDLRERTENFWLRIQGKGSHTAGWTYDFYEFRKKFKLEQLEVQWLELPESEIGELETVLLMDYVAKYLDKPPLNIHIPRY
jgi:hypothetical protein